MTLSCARCLAASVLLSFASMAASQQLVVGAGSRLSLGSGSLDVGCADLRVAGALDIGSGSLRAARNVAVDGTLLGGSGVLALSADLEAAAGLSAQSGTVRIQSGCGSAGSHVIGNHAFHRLVVENTSAFALVLPAGGLQSIASVLMLRGGAERLHVRSSASGSVALLALAPGAEQSIHRVDVVDVGAPAEAQHLAPGEPSSVDSVDRGNSPFFFGAAQALRPLVVPVLTTFWFAVLLSLTAALALVILRRRASN